MGLEKYKYLVTVGCSQTFGHECIKQDTWSYKLATELGLKEINLAVSGTGWYYLENVVTSFIHYNKDIIHECFFILQKSTLERRLVYNESFFVETDIFEEYNIPFLSQVAVASIGFKDWLKYKYEHLKPDWIKVKTAKNRGAQWIHLEKVNKNLNFLPEHRHYSNTLHHWKIGDDHNIYPDKIQTKINELFLHWGQRVLGLHLLLKNLNVDHLIVDGYSPFVSSNLNFRNYYDTDEEFEWVKDFWSMNDPEDDILLYDFKNIPSKWLFDSIDIRYKIDDVVLWSLYQFKEHNTSWNIDGGHAGPDGMNLIKNVIKQNLEEKKWI